MMIVLKFWGRWTGHGLWQIDLFSSVHWTVFILFVSCFSVWLIVCRWFLSNVCLVFVCCLSGVSLVLVSCLSHVFLMLSGVLCLLYVFFAFLWCLPYVSLVFVWCWSHVSLVFALCFFGVCLMFVWCLSGVGLMFLCCSSAVGLMLVLCLSGTWWWGSWLPCSTSPGPSHWRLRTSPSCPPPQGPCTYWNAPSFIWTAVLHSLIFFSTRITLHQLPF